MDLGESKTSQVRDVVDKKRYLKYKTARSNKGKGSLQERIENLESFVFDNGE